MPFLLASASYQYQLIGFTKPHLRASTLGTYHLVMTFLCAISAALFSIDQAFLAAVTLADLTENNLIPFGAITS